MTIEEGIQQYLIADATLAALVGDRVYPQQALESDTMPLVCYASSDAEQQMAPGGPMNFYFVRMRFDCYGSAGDYATGKAVGRAIHARLVGFRGELGAGAVTVCGVFDDGSSDELEPPLHADELGLPAISVGVRIYYGLA